MTAPKNAANDTKVTVIPKISEGARPDIHVILNSAHELVLVHSMTPIRIIPADTLAEHCGVSASTLAKRAWRIGARLLRGYTPRDARRILNTRKRGRPPSRKSKR